jgi:hypothetical protein
MTALAKPCSLLGRSKRYRTMPTAFFSLSASRYFDDKETLCPYWPLGTVVITGPKVLDFYAELCPHRAASLKPDGKDILSVTIVLNSKHSRGDPGK